MDADFDVLLVSGGNGEVCISPVLLCVMCCGVLCVRLECGGVWIAWGADDICC